MDATQAEPSIYQQTLERVCAYYQVLQGSALLIVSPRRDGLRARLYAKLQQQWRMVPEGSSAGRPGNAQGMSREQTREHR